MLGCRNKVDHEVREQRRRRGCEGEECCFYFKAFDVVAASMFMLTRILIWNGSDM